MQKFVKGWSGESGHDSDRILSLRKLNANSSYAQFIPPSIPQAFADQLLKLHSVPPAWWVGQFIGYLMRPLPGIQAKLDQELSKNGLWSGDNNTRPPIVGVHIRRGDKLNSEAEYHSLEEYMRWVELYFDSVEMQRIRAYGNSEVKGNTTTNGFKRRIYIATDDPAVFDEAKKKYVCSVCKITVRSI